MWVQDIKGLWVNLAQAERLYPSTVNLKGKFEVWAELADCVAVIAKMPTIEQAEALCTSIAVLLNQAYPPVSVGALNKLMEMVREGEAGKSEQPQTPDKIPGGDT